MYRCVTEVKTSINLLRITDYVFLIRRISYKSRGVTGRQQRFDVLTTVNMSILVSWVVASYSLVGGLKCIQTEIKVYVLK